MKIVQNQRITREEVLRALDLDKADKVDYSEEDSDSESDYFDEENRFN